MTDKETGEKKEITYYKWCEIRYNYWLSEDEKVTPNEAGKRFSNKATASRLAALRKKLAA